jgi:hypothetical protein
MLIASSLAWAQSDGSVLPKPSPPFGGTIGKTYQESKPDFPKPIAAPKGAPNVLLILTDDTVWRSRRDADARSSQQRGAAIQPPAHDRAVLADPRCASDRTQSPLRRHGRDH